MKNEVFTTDWREKKVISHKPEMIGDGLVAIPKNYIGRPQAIKACYKLNKQGINCHIELNSRGYFFIVVD